jgi:hypothetical protein
MTVSQNGTQLFQGVVDCVDLGDLPDAVSEGIVAFQRANPHYAKRGPFDALSIDLCEIGGKAEGDQLSPR